MARDARVDRRRHGRGARTAGRLGPARPDHLAAAVRQTLAVLDRTLPTSMRSITFLVEDLPTVGELERARRCPLGRWEPGNPAQVILYRKPLESRCTTKLELDILVRDTLAELVGQAVGVRPTVAVPAYGEPDRRQV